MLQAQTTRHPMLVDRLAEHVYGRILRRELAPGQRITENELAVDFGVSRTPVREAVERLVEMGVIVAYPRARLEVAKVSGEELCEILQLREDLECLALTYAVPRMSDGDVVTLAASAAHCCKVALRGDRIETFRADAAFHHAIAGLAGNRYLVEMLQRLGIKVQLCRATLCVTDKSIRSSVRFHLKIVEAIRRRSVDEACSLMREHVRAALHQAPQTKAKR